MRIVYVFGVCVCVCVYLARIFRACYIATKNPTESDEDLFHNSSMCQ